MAQFTVDDKVYVPATITSVTENQDGVFYDVKFRAINSTKTVSVEESDIVARNTNTNNNTNTTPTDSTTEQSGTDTQSSTDTQSGSETTDP